MRKDKKEAIKLRSLGKSYAEIRACLAVPKSTLSNWFVTHEWSKRVIAVLNQKHLKTNMARLRQLNRVRGKILENIYKEAEKEAEKEFEQLKHHPLFVAALMLYWGEGDKTTKYNITLANSDPAMIRLFTHFLINICQVKKEKIKLHLLLYPDLSETEVKKYWIEHTDFEETNFTKNTIIQGRHKTRRLKYGVCNATVSSTYLKTKLFVWLKLIPGALLSKQYYNADIV